MDYNANVDGTICFFLSGSRENLSVLTDFTGKGVLVYIFAASDNDIDHIDFITENKCRNMELITQ